MEIFWFVVLAIIAVVVIYGILIYNNLVSLKHQVSQARTRTQLVCEVSVAAATTIPDQIREDMNFSIMADIGEVLDKALEPQAVTT